MKHQKLINKIIEAVPEIEKREILYRCNRVWEAWQVNTMKEEDFEEVDLSEIITLADVLYTIEQYFEDDKNGDAIPTGDIPEIKELLSYWQFSRNDNLDHQSKETIKFLEDILL